MQSRIASILGLKYQPVVLLWSDDKPEQAVEFKPGRWGCVMFSFAAAAKGRQAVFARETYGCWGGGVGLGFGNRYLDFPGGEECFHYFLSCGNKHFEPGKSVAEHLKGPGMEEFCDDFLEGERYLKGPEEVRAFVKNLPIVDIPASYVVLKPLALVKEDEVPKTITFLVNPDQLSALVVLASYGRRTCDNVTMPFAAGCQTIGILSYAEGKRDEPRAVVGLTDISARKNVRKLLDHDLLSFSMPLNLFEEMENNVDESFLFRTTWKSMVG
ncbi:DUF169 domain-containing protein [Desulfonatronovibrio hydrogenovorans]|uniref:DUF169 domain-containing protein n=1 Tax=Desulfonatronovibrio hydrogenovorans TaxID=53245 RepID=UPI00048BFF5D|nr:DUF169 domain-containing protein [Desulfonatronovibrio hydrogenovorans]